ncbi:MAG: hypothetical protein BWZ10_02630 [candidate division BRC1 bacterium ADurb.BinA364]|nr:MAG: hypothetical protein BWZ10_02630 [candidate division BRC1 bacterium ADurb.BinA364]
MAALAGDASADMNMASAESALKSGDMVVLDGKTGKAQGAYAFEPLEPFFGKAQFWQSVSVSQDGRRAAVGLDDGRSFIFDLETLAPERVFDFGAPIPISGIPVAASATYAKIAPDGIAYFQTGPSSVPSGDAAGRMASPPGPHPNAFTIAAVGTDGEVLWRYRGGQHYQNFWTSADGRWVFSCAQADDPQSGRPSGAILFDTRRPGGGSAKLAYFYPIEGMAFFQADISADGALIALVETPYLDSETRRLRGRYQVHIVR